MQQTESNHPDAISLNMGQDRQEDPKDPNPLVHKGLIHMKYWDYPLVILP